jgi:C4-dicarboxylate transporter DctQ subunit
MRRWVKGWVRAEEWVVGYGLLALALLAFVQVVLRYVFHYSFVWFQELARYGGIFLTFLGASLGVQYGTHFAMEALLQPLSSRWFHAVKIFVNLTCGLFFLMVAYFGFLHSQKLHRYGVLTAAMRIPMYLPYLPIPVFCTTMAIRHFHLVWRHGRALVDSRPDERER